MMKYSWEEMEQLASILSAEAEGQPVDRDHARHLAERLAENCPGIRHTMHRIRDRMR